MASKVIILSSAIAVIITLTFFWVNRNASQKLSKSSSAPHSDSTPSNTQDDFELDTATTVAMRQEFEAFPVYFGSVIDRRITPIENGYQINMLVNEDLPTLLSWYLIESEDHDWEILKDGTMPESFEPQEVIAEHQNIHYILKASQEGEYSRLIFTLTTKNTP